MAICFHFIFLYLSLLVFDFDPSEGRVRSERGSRSTREITLCLRISDLEAYDTIHIAFLAIVTNIAIILALISIKKGQKLIRQTDKPINERFI